MTCATGERKVVHQRRLVRALRPHRASGVRQPAARCSPCRSTSSGLEIAGSPGAGRSRASPSNPGEGGAQFAFSQRRHARLPAAAAPRSQQLPVAVRSTATGGTTLLVDEPGALRQPAACRPTASGWRSTVLRDDNWDIWVYDLERGVATRLTFDDARDRADLVARRRVHRVQLGRGGMPTTSIASAPTARAKRSACTSRRTRMWAN